MARREREVSERRPAGATDPDVALGEITDVEEEADRLAKLSPEEIRDGARRSQLPQSPPSGQAADSDADRH